MTIGKENTQRGQKREKVAYIKTAARFALSNHICTDLCCRIEMTNFKPAVAVLALLGLLQAALAYHVSNRVEDNEIEQDSREYHHREHDMTKHQQQTGEQYFQCIEKHERQLYETCGVLTPQVKKVAYECADALEIHVPCKVTDILEGPNSECDRSEEPDGAFVTFIEEAESKCLATCVIGKLGALYRTSEYPNPEAAWSYLERYILRGRRTVTEKEKLRVAACMYYKEHGNEPEYGFFGNATRPDVCIASENFLLCLSEIFEPEVKECFQEECRQMGYVSHKRYNLTPAKSIPADDGLQVTEKDEGDDEYLYSSSASSSTDEEQDEDDDNQSSYEETEEEDTQLPQK